MPPTTLSPDIVAFIGLAVLVCATGFSANAIYSILHPKRIYFRRSRLLTPAELRFFHTLQAATKNEFWIFPKVRIADLVDIHGLRTRQWWRKFAQISQKHADFVLADRKTLEVLAVIELDDNSHQTGDRRRRDALINSVFLEANIPLRRFQVNTSTARVHDVLYQTIRIRQASHNCKISFSYRPIRQTHGLGLTVRCACNLLMSGRRLPQIDQRSLLLLD